MKKIWLALAGLVLAFSASAAQYEDGKLLTIDESKINLNNIALINFARLWGGEISLNR